MSECWMCGRAVPEQITIFLGELEIPLALCSWECIHLASEVALVEMKAGRFHSLERPE